MSFFKQFPKAKYDLKGDGKDIEIKDIFRFVDVNSKIDDPATAYQLYYIKDGERPDVVSRKLYQSDRFYWTFFIINDFLKAGYSSWPKSYNELQEIKKKYYTPYSVITLDPPSMTEILKITNPISELYVAMRGLSGVGGVHSSNHEVVGKLYKIDAEKNQIWIDGDVAIDTTGGTNYNTILSTKEKIRNICTQSRHFDASSTDMTRNYKTDETYSNQAGRLKIFTLSNGVSTKHGTGSGDPDNTYTWVGNNAYQNVASDYSVELHGMKGYSYAYNAPYYFKNSDGIAYTNADAALNQAFDNPYTYSEFLEDENDKNTAIRVIKPQHITEFADIYKELIRT